jgi:hypothetical protein
MGLALVGQRWADNDQVARRAISLQRADRSENPLQTIHVAKGQFRRQEVPVAVSSHADDGTGLN